MQKIDLNKYVVSHLSSKHSSSCAVYDPTPGYCTCNPVQIPLVKLSDALAAVQAEQVVVLDEIKTIISDLKELFKHTIKGEWKKGKSTHETVSVSNGREPYRIADFRHADDAAFCDAVHNNFENLMKFLDSTLDMKEKK